jgi:transaldolase
MQTLKIKLFADGANLESMLKLAQFNYVQGFTTNPTIMRKDGVTDYKSFSKELISKIPNKPISLEVFSDDLQEMVRQAQEIASWGDNVYVKIPVTNTKGESTVGIVNMLSNSGVKINVTGIFTLDQVISSAMALRLDTPSIISVFAGRIADTGTDPKPIMLAAKKICEAFCSKTELLWASPRELYNIVEAESCGSDIITVGHDLLNKISLFGKDLTEFSLDTIKMFHEDSIKAGYSL